MFEVWKAATIGISTAEATLLKLRKEIKTGHSKKETFSNTPTTKVYPVRRRNHKQTESIGGNMEKKTGKKLNLTKKQFIIAIAAVCGIALIIEAALLVHTFSKGKGDKKKGNAGKAGTEKQAEDVAEARSYTVTTYRYENGEQILEKVEMLETDCDGRILHEHTFRAAPLKGENSDEDVVYTYDEEGRLIKEVHTTNQNRPDKTTFRYEYDYDYAYSK